MILYCQCYPGVHIHFVLHNRCCTLNHTTFLIVKAVKLCLFVNVLNKNGVKLTHLPCFLFLLFYCANTQNPPQAKQLITTVNRHFKVWKFKLTVIMKVYGKLKLVLRQSTVGRTHSELNWNYFIIILCGPSFALHAFAEIETIRCSWEVGRA